MLGSAERVPYIYILYARNGYYVAEIRVLGAYPLKPVEGRQRIDAHPLRLGFIK